MKKISSDDRRLRHVFASNLKRFLRERGSTQMEFAQAIDMNNVQVSRWVNEKAPPSWDAIIAISSVLEIPPYELFKDDEYEGLHGGASYEFNLFQKFRRFARTMRA